MKINIKLGFGLVYIIAMCIYAPWYVSLILLLIGLSLTYVNN